MPKNVLREALLAQRAALSRDEWLQASCAAQQRLLGMPLFSKADCIALYAPIRHELDTALLFHAACAQGKHLLYPQVSGDLLVFRQVRVESDFVLGSFGVLEPRSDLPAVSVEAAQLIVVPGVAFDCQGYRIGFGKGFYDRALACCDRQIDLVGFCHDFQVVASVPAEAHDVRMKYVVTDARCIRVGTGDKPD